MKALIILFVILQLSVLPDISLAQITFTREWVTGKRSGNTGGSPKLKIMMHDESQTFCASLLPVIDYLMEVEKVHQKMCGPLSKPYSVPVLLRKLTTGGNALPPSNTEPQYEDNAGFEDARARLQKAS